MKLPASLTPFEKVLLLEMLMMDIRHDWDKNPQDRHKDPRVLACIQIIWECQNFTHNKRDTNYIFIEMVKWHGFMQNIGLYLTGKYEGRILKESHYNGGYEGLHLIHRLPYQFSKQTKPFCFVAKQLLRTRFDFMDK